MARSNDFPGLPFIRAKGYTKGRPDGPPLWIVWHTMEVDELPDRAENTAQYFADPSDGREVSSHWCVDNNSAVQSVNEQDVAWTVGNRPGNNRGVNFELAGRARQTRTQWLDAYGRGLFATAAPIVARSMTRWDIPNRWCSIADLEARRPGHTTHNDLRVAFGGTTHTDPGGEFPRDHVLQVVAAALAGGEADMPLSDEDLTKVRSAVVGGVVDAFEVAAQRGAPDAPPTARQFDNALRTVFQRLLLGALSRDVDGSYLIWRMEALTRLRDPLVVQKPDGTTDVEANALAQLLHGIEAQLAASATRETAAATAISALASALAGGQGSGTVDSAAIIAAVRNEGETTRQALIQLRQENDALRSRLAAALADPTSEGSG